MYCQCCICQQLIAEYYTFLCPACGQQPLVAVPLCNNCRVCNTQSKPGGLQITAPATRDFNADFSSKPLYTPNLNSKFVENDSNSSQQDDESSWLTSNLQGGASKRSWTNTGVHFDVEYLDPVFSTNTQNENEALSEQIKGDQRIVALQRELSGLRDTKQQKSRSNTNQEQIRSLSVTNESKEAAKDLRYEKQGELEIMKDDENEVCTLLKQQKINGELGSTRRESQMGVANRTTEQEVADLKWRRKVSELAANEAARRSQELDDRVKFRRSLDSDSSTLQYKDTADKSMDTITVQTDTRSTQYLPCASVNNDGLLLDSQMGSGRMPVIYSPVCPIYNRDRGAEGICCCCCKYRTNMAASANGALAITNNYDNSDSRRKDSLSSASNTNRLNQNNTKSRDLLMAQKCTKICNCGTINKVQGDYKSNVAFMKSKESLSIPSCNCSIGKQNEDSEIKRNKKSNGCGACRKNKKSSEKQRNSAEKGEKRKSREEERIQEEAARCCKAVPMKNPRTSPGCSIQ